MNPYFPKHACAFNEGAIKLILSLPCTERAHFKEKAFMSLTIFAAFRAQDVYNLLSKNVRKVGPLDNSPRCLELYLTKTKNDPQGTGDPKDRTFFILCLCGDVLESIERKAFQKKVKVDVNHQCVVPCPYGVICDYMAQLPDVSGALREADIAAGIPLLESLRFMRAQATLGDRRYLTGPLGEFCLILKLRPSVIIFQTGINPLGAIPATVNARLPEDFRVSSATGHTGRRTYATTAMNNGEDAVVVAKTTNHRDVNVLKSYVDVDQVTKMSPALHFGAKIVGENMGCSSSSNQCGQKRQRTNAPREFYIHAMDSDYESDEDAAGCGEGSVDGEVIVLNGRVFREEKKKK